MIIALQTLLFFRETLIRALDAFLRPYYKNFSLALTRQGDVSDDEGSEDHVFAEYHDEKGVVFFPPVYVQRYAAVTDCLMDDNWCGRLEKVVEFGYHDLSFIKYLKEVPGIQHIMGVDIEAIPLQSSSDLLGCEDYGQKRENPLKVTLFQGNAADPDYRLIGCDAVVAIEMIEHMLPHDLERFLHTVFGFIKPWVVVLTTPNGDFNVLFKSLENNGLRRLDHFFEWSREQFYDWCSNIVLRYPDYTVTCKGIGPGPPDTAQLGCCTQMAVFVAKDYHKQQELDISSLALVASKDVPSLSIEDMTSSYECIPDNKILCLTNDVELYPEISSNKQSCVTIVLTSPMYSYHAIEYDDKSFQCNLDTELEKAFLFEDEPYRVLIPRRKRLYKIYDIEDVNNRLNCSTLQVKKFSKTTQNVIAMNKMDSSFTREVVDEIRHLKKMLNLNKECECTGEHTWFNINWGENAPYWNQYYRVVREYSYPFERKSDDSRILDLISEEINRLVDKQWDDDFPSEGNLEIPLTLLMDVVAHLTNDVDKVKELLEWNGYQVVDDVVIHSRLIVDTTSVGTHDDDWPDNDTVSDWDISEVHSTSISDGSTNMPDYYGRCLRKALDHKVRKLRTLLSADEDITSELDGVVCRLMKLALHTTRNRQCPVPSSWVQCKLFDLLTLTEKAIERRRKHYFDECMLKAIDNGKSKDKNSILALINVKLENRRADEIMHKYRNLIEPIRTFDDDKFKLSENCIEELDLEDDNEFFQDENQNLQIVSEPISHDEEIESVMQKPKTKLDIVREWIGGDYKNMFSSYHQDMDVSKSTYQIHNIQSNYSVAGYLDKIDISSPSSGTVDDKIKLDRKPTKSHPKTAKKSSKRKMNYTFLLKKYYSKFGDTDTMCKNKGKKHHKQLSIAAAPIPNSLIELCRKTEKEHVKTETENACKIRDVSDYVNYDNIAATEKCHIISIITQDSEEQVALRRSIGTDPGPSIIDHEAALETVINITKHDSLCNFKEYDSEDVPGQMIFLYDINEPSTSKGIRRGGLDVQCGPDDVPHCDMLSATTSFTKFPKLFSKGIKIEHSTTNICCEKTFDEGTSPDFTSPYKSAHPYMGIRIIDSDTKIQDKNVTESTTMTTHDFLDDTSKCCNPKTTLIKSISVNETDHIKSPKRLLSPLLKSDVQIQSGGSKVDIGRKSPVRVKSKLSCGGIHVHSFKDREVSQDVIFQGGWNEITPDKLAKKNNKKAVPKKVVYTTKKLKRGSNTSVKNHGNSDVKNALKRPIKIRTTKQILKKEQTNKIMPNKKFPPTRNRNMLIRNVKKASSKTVSNTLENTNAIRHKEITKPASFERPNIEHYLPAYLKRNRSAGVNKFSSKSLDSPKLINIKKPQFLRSSMEEKSNLRQQFIRCNSEDEKRNDLKEIKNNSTVYVSYQVFRNEVKNKRITEKVQSANRQVIGSNSTPKRSGSPDSQLSTCSSPNSVGTVRAVSSIVTVDSCKKCSTSSTTNNRNSPTATIPKTNFGSKIKNIIKKNKYEKKNDNKENIPTPLKNAKRGFVGTTKNIFRAHTSCDTTHLSKTKLHLKKSSNKLPNIKSSGNLLKKSSSLLSEKVNDEPSNENNVLQSSPSDTVLILERFSSYKDLSKDLDESINFNSNNLFSKTTEHIDEVCINPNCITSKSAHSMEILIKDMLEETLKSISITPESNLKRDILFKNDKSLNNTSSPISFKTVIENKDSSSFKLSLEEAIDTSFNKVSENASITEKTEKKSLESMCTSSKQSEYFLADNQLDLCEFSSMINEPSDSVQGLFERKNQNIVTNVGGPIALQAFSGFSVNGIPLAGDQPQYINLVDPESGLLRPQINRQTESEEILLSGRSSDTYESCYVEDESFVPSWLFNLINQHHSNDESEEDENLVPYPLPIAEPVLDIDDVDIDGVGVGAGAGDGRGVHSDRSRDSSGRGTSLSSSETSTDTPTGGEAVIVDPSTFVGLYEFVREAADSSTFDRPNESPDTSFTTAEADTGDVNRPRSRSRTAASDIDADVSSLDTDAIDSDNYE